MEAQLELRDTYGMTILMHAVVSGNLEVVRAVVRYARPSKVSICQFRSGETYLYLEGISVVQ